MVSERDLAFEGSIDLAIRYGAAPLDDGETTFLVRQAISPTCAKTFLPAGTKLEPSELLEYPLIHLEGPYDDHTRWSTWCQIHELNMARVRAGITVNSYTNLVQAVLDGQGFGLIGPPLVERFLSNGTLIQPVNVQPVVRHAFHLSLPRTSAPSASAEAFADWIKASFPAKRASARGGADPAGERPLLT